MIIISDKELIKIPEKDCKDCIHYWKLKDKERCTADNGIKTPEFVCSDYEEV